MIVLFNPENSLIISPAQACISASCTPLYELLAKALCFSQCQYFVIASMMDFTLSLPTYYQ